MNERLLVAVGPRTQLGGEPLRRDSPGRWFCLTRYVSTTRCFACCTTPVPTGATFHLGSHAALGAPLGNYLCDGFRRMSGVEKGVNRGVKQSSRIETTRL